MSSLWKHFPEIEIIRDDKYLQPNGNLIKIPIKSKLKANAVFRI